MLCCSLILWTACEQKSQRQEAVVSESTPTAPPLFILLPAEQTHVDFNNQLTEGLNTNVMAYEYFYNGGGVAIGDVNGDGWEDIYFTGNMTPNRLYLNLGKQEDKRLQFQDVTREAGVAGRNTPWTTGVTMADVNGDGLLDIYVCYSGNVRPENRTNQLFINQGADSSGIPHFTEEAATYGLASPATSTQAVFFDYDRDGDLDMFLLNHSPVPLPVLDEYSTAEILKKEHPNSGVRLFRNDLKQGRTFYTDITQQAGISSSSLTYGLGAGVADINGDLWPDIYISNDYAIPDYLYINNGEGTGQQPAFSNKLQEHFGHTSHFSMGNDVADINNDALPDVYTLDMLPEDNRRQKLLFAPDNYEKFNLNLKVGFHYQYMRNMLQINQGNIRGGNPKFSEVGQMAGVSNTDWSWAPLFADYDNDGWKDLFVTNGYVRDFTNMDFMKYMGDFLHNHQGNLLRRDVLELVHQMPSSNVVNYIYKNNGGDPGKAYTFTNMSRAWGMQIPSNSNGAAFADLDHDGDLELVVSNINQSAFIFRNESDKQHHYLQVALKGSGFNTYGIGAQLTLYWDGQKQFLEQMPTRGYQSSVAPSLHFGLGKADRIDSLRIVWPSGKQQIIRRIKADQRLTLTEADAQNKYKKTPEDKPLFVPVKSPVAFAPKPSNVNDFKRQPLMVNPLSFSGPCMAKGDVNGDGQDDIYVGGAAGQAGQLFLGKVNASFVQKDIATFQQDAGSEDTDAIFFDANQDGFPDLYVCSGGYAQFVPEDKALQDRLYLNDGKGNFTRSTAALPVMLTSSSCARAADVNEDGFPDLFVGGRVIPGRYPETPVSYVLINDGQGSFIDKTAAISPTLGNIGMVTDAAWSDLDGDKRSELIVVGEWMPVSVFTMQQGKLNEATDQYFEKEYRGWWNKLLVEDLNRDGRPDLVIGNMGENTQCQASDRQPAELFYKDFDDNGSVDPIFSFYIQGQSYPSVTRDELLDQMSIMRSRFPDYKSYANAQLEDIFTPEELKDAKHLKANELKTLYLTRTAEGKFKEQPLPRMVQSSPVFTITPLDYNQDTHTDLLLCGNINQARLRFGKSDANYGILLKGNANGEFEYIPQPKSGFALKGDVRSVIKTDKILLFGINGQEVEAYRF